MSWLSTAHLPRPHDSDAWPWHGPAGARRPRCPTTPTFEALLDALFGNSPYLTETAPTEPRFLGRSMARAGPMRRRSTLDASLRRVPADALPEPQPDASLAARCGALKRSVALAVAVADIAGAWPLERVTGALSGFADAALDAVADAILLQPSASGQLALGGDPQAAGLTVLGMGKLGARELNYSSDIDLIVLYDARACRRWPAASDRAPCFVRAGARPGAAHGGAHGRRLCLPHRPAAAARSRLDAAGDVGAGGRDLLRERRPELGARGDDQGAAGGRRPRRRRGVPRPSCGPSSGASISTSRPSRTSSRSSARSTPIAAAARSRSRATTSSSAAAASARSSSSPRPSS